MICGWELWLSSRALILFSSLKIFFCVKFFWFGKFLRLFCIYERTIREMNAVKILPCIVSLPWVYVLLMSISFLRLSKLFR